MDGDRRLEIYASCILMIQRTPLSSRPHSDPSFIPHSGCHISRYRLLYYGQDSRHLL